MADPRLDRETILPDPSEGARLVGRVWAPGLGPRLVTVSGEFLVDITALGPTMAQLLKHPSPAEQIREVETGRDPDAQRWPIAEVLSCTAREADRRRGSDVPQKYAGVAILSPVDVQVLKAAGVTFVRSMLERVIEERVGGDPTKAAAVRNQLQRTLSSAIHDVRPGSPDALRALQVLRENGLWSQYLQVGLGTYPEVFTKAPVLSSVGHGSDVGIAGISAWNNPEPELVLVMDSEGKPKGVTLGNDANLRDIEGASALLLPLAKDNNASAAIGPFIRLLDENFTLEQAANLTITMRIQGLDGYGLEATAPQADISRPISSLIGHTVNRRQQFPDGLVLFCGTPFAPTDDRGELGQGFTHKEGDLVSISSPQLGTLVNRVTTSERAPMWSYGILDLFRDLQNGLRA